MRRIRTWSLLFVALGVLWACRVSVDLTPPTQDSGSVIPTPVLTGGVTPAPAGGGANSLPPTSPPVSPTPAGTPVTCPGQPFRLRIPQGMALSLQCFQTTFGTVDSPQTITIWRVATSPADAFCDQGCVDIIPLADAQQVLGGFVFPPEGQNGAVLYEAQRQNLGFVSGQGVRTLEVQGQGVALVSNVNLRYVFRGTSTNGKYAVYVTWPITAPGLPDAEMPDLNTNPQVFAPLPPANDPAQWDTFNQQAVQYLNGLTPQQFTPSLTLLDALVQSIDTGP